jgi:hypothetical protein
VDVGLYERHPPGIARFQVCGRLAGVTPRCWVRDKMHRYLVRLSFLAPRGFGVYGYARVDSIFILLNPTRVP